MLRQLSFWPWALAGAYTFLVTLILTARRLEGHVAANLLIYGLCVGGGALMMSLAVLIEAARAGFLVGRSAPDILGLFSGVFLCGALVSMPSFVVAFGISKNIEIRNRRL